MEAYCHFSMLIYICLAHQFVYAIVTIEKNNLCKWQPPGLQKFGIIALRYTSTINFVSTAWLTYVKKADE